METAPILDSKWFFGGNATFTVENPKGDYYTFKVVKKEQNAFYHETFFIKVMTGSDNERNYTYVGVLRRNGTIVLTRGSKLARTDIRVRVAEWAMRAMITGTLPDGYRIHHAGNCGVCGRKLTTPESVLAGVGPVCAGRF